MVACNQFLVISFNDKFKILGLTVNHSQQIVNKPSNNHANEQLMIWAMLIVKNVNLEKKQ